MATSSTVSTEKDGSKGTAPMRRAEGAEGSENAASAASAQNAASESAEGLPRTLGRYLLLRRIARGGMGEVFLGTTTGLEGAERPVVVKLIRREHAKDPSFIARFLDEARVQAQLHHSGVAQVLEAATDEATGEPYAVVEHVEGKSLGDLRARALQIGYRIAWVEAVAVATMIAEALSHVHERPDAAGRALSIVHRDLSPQNVMLSFSGDVKIIDFGTARGQNRRCRTVAGVVFAKPGYVAPEVANGDSGDARVDVYALGVMLWELCAGRRFLQGDATAHMAGVARNQIQPPAIAVACGAPAELDAIIRKLTAFDRDARYAETRVVACDLAKLLSGAPGLPGGERSVRARAARLMQSLFPSEPSRSRREFAKLVAAAQAQQKSTSTAAAKASAPQPKASAPQPKADALEDKPSWVPIAPSPPSLQASLPSDEPDEPGLLPGTRYRLGRELGRGAGGVVYEAEHVDLNRRVAVKVLASEHTGIKEFATRFRREARAMSRVSHESLVKIIDFGLASDGRLFCVMELLDGETLEQRLARDRSLGWREALHLAATALRALEVTHEAQIIHRDIKPANLFLTRSGGVKLLDFGLAKSAAPPTSEAAGSALSSGEDLTKRAGLTILGTPEYMAPEQAASGQGDARSDIYALGCVIYEAITGGLPFVGSSTVAVLAAKVKGSPERLMERSPAVDIPRGVDDLVMRALARHPSVRFQSAAEMREAIEQALAAPAQRRASRRVMGMSALAATMAFAFVLVAGRAKEIRHVVAEWSSAKPQVAAVVDPQAPPDPAAPPTLAEQPSTDPSELQGRAPVEATPVHIGPEPLSAEGDGDVENEPVALESGEEDEEGEDIGAASDQGTKPAHSLTPIAPKPARSRQHSKKAQTAQSGRPPQSEHATAPAAKAAAKADSPKPTASSKVSTSGADKSAAASSGHASSKDGGDRSAPKGNVAKDSVSAGETVSSSKGADPIAAAKGDSPSHDIEPADASPSAAGSKASEGERTPQKVAPSKSTRKDGAPRRKKKSRLAKKAE